MTMVPIRSYEVPANRFTDAVLVLSSIPQTYKHLQLRSFWSPLNTPNGNYTLASTFNNDGFPGTGEYVYHWMQGNGASTSSGVSTTANWSAQLAEYSAFTGVAGTTNPQVFNAAITDIFDYSNPNQKTTIKTVYGADFNGSGTAGMISAVQHSVAEAISTITIWHTNTGGSWRPGTRFDLYGIVG
jgi:hypothetical protein